jgi:hypothetical protein
MDVAQLKRDVSVVGGCVEVSVIARCRSVVIPNKEALPRIAYISITLGIKITDLIYMYV